MSPLKTAPSIIGLIIAAAVIGPGCGIQSGNTIMTQGMRNDPVMGTAPNSGQYELFTATGLNPIATAKVDRGQPLGFDRAADGHWVAIAGEQHFDLPRGTAQAYWKIQ